MIVPGTKEIRHHITKIPVVKYPLTWLQHRGLRQGDVFIASYPRAGSTWLRFMLYEILTGKDPDFTAVDQAITGVGKHTSAPSLLPGGGRLLQTHEPYRPEYKKAIYLVRDVRDVVISEYYFCRQLRFYKGEFDGFIEKFMAGKVNRYGFWGDHVNSWLVEATVNPANVLIVKFENLRHRPEGVLGSILSFLGMDKSEDTIKAVVENNSITRMQQKEDKSAKFKDSTNGLRFINKGLVGTGKQRLSEQQKVHLEATLRLILDRLDYNC